MLICFGGKCLTKDQTVGKHACDDKLTCMRVLDCKPYSPAAVEKPQRDPGVVKIKRKKNLYSERDKYLVAGIIR